MIRMTVTEVASFLGKRPSWVYNLLSKNARGVSGLLEYPTILWLVQTKFEYLKYSDIDYHDIVHESYLQLLSKCTCIASLNKHLMMLNDQIFIELVIAYKVLRPSNSISNILQKLSKELKYSMFVSDVKGYVKDALRQYLAKYPKLENLQKYFIVKKDTYSLVEQEVIQSLLLSIKNSQI